MTNYILPLSTKEHRVALSLVQIQKHIGLIQTGPLTTVDGAMTEKPTAPGFNGEFPLTGGSNATVRRWYLHRVFVAAAASLIFSPPPISACLRKWFLMKLPTPPFAPRLDQPRTRSLTVSPPAFVAFCPFHLSSFIDPTVVDQLCVNNVCRVSAGARCPNLSPANAVDSGVFFYFACVWWQWKRGLLVLAYK